ncbi:unnamed protein product [Musa acuminata subsp. burmannicoides]
MYSNSLPLCLRMSGFCSEKLLWRTTIRWDGGRSFLPGTSHARAREIFWVFASKSGSSFCRLPWKLSAFYQSRHASLLISVAVSERIPTYAATLDPKAYYYLGC